MHNTLEVLILLCILVHIFKLTSNMRHTKLTSIRKSKMISQEEMATQLGMEQTTYSRKERGISPITQEEWKRFAKILDVSAHEIKDDPIPTYKNENCTLHDNNIGTEYIQIHQELLASILRYTNFLEEEVQRLKKE